MNNKISHILIVDDNPENIRVLGTVLRQKSYRLTIAQNGVQAVKAAQEHLPDLILLDIMMPEMDGFEVCRILKSAPETQDIEIIFVTAAVAHDDELKGLSLGAVDYIHKPFAIPLVQSKVALHLERAQRKKELKLKNAILEENVRLRDDIERITRHDLKTPLNALMGYPQLLLLDDNLTEEQRGYLEAMMSASNEMLNMINNSLNLFKMEIGCYQYVPETVDIAGVIKSVLRDLKLLIDKQGVMVHLDLIHQPDNDQPFYAQAERNLSYSMFANLIRNAIEVCQHDDLIVIQLSYKYNNAMITITNPGSVPESVRETFFDKYSTAGKIEGTGLGTYSAKLMATTQQGDITMSTSSEETCLTVSLPYLNE